jgi:hypothetical protein
LHGKSTSSWPRELIILAFNLLILLATNSQGDRVLVPRNASIIHGHATSALLIARPPLVENPKEHRQRKLSLWMVYFTNMLSAMGMW